MRKKLNCKWRKGGQKVDETESGYAETVYECFDYIKPIPLMKYSDGNIWYIGDIKKGEQPNPVRLFYNETEVRIEFEKVKAFQHNELATSRYKFELMSPSELYEWLEKNGHNPYAGSSVYLGTVLRLQEQKQKAIDMEM